MRNVRSTNGKGKRRQPSEPRDFLGNSNGLYRTLPSTVRGVTFQLTRLAEYNPT
jgi:hypothetical protein